MRWGDGQEGGVGRAGGEGVEVCDSPDITPVLAYLYNVTGSSGQECSEKKACSDWVVGDVTQPRQHDDVGETWYFSNKAHFHNLQANQIKQTNSSGKRLTYKKNKGSSGSAKTSSGSSRNQSLTPSLTPSLTSQDKMETRPAALAASKVLTEKRPSLTGKPVHQSRLENWKY